VALEHPQIPELKRFDFFVSRRLEEGRERFRRLDGEQVGDVDVHRRP
jgi:hypothetical protein